MNIPMPDTNEKKSILQYLRRSLPSSTQRNGVFDYVKSLLNNGGKVAISSITDEQTGEATAQMKIDINAKQGNTQTTYTNKNGNYIIIVYNSSYSNKDTMVCCLLFSEIIKMPIFLNLYQLMLNSLHIFE